ncbi:MAG: prepilin-type N-terminal cleavage/methylation domain-containing protein [Desulfobacteraceae bacterium]
MKRLIHSIKRRKMNTEGFTLLEAMISLFVFSIGILGVLALQSTGIANNTLAEDVQLNTVFAMGGIEELMATDFQDQRVIDANAGIPFQLPTTDPRYQVFATSTPNAAIPGAKRIVVTGRFTPKGGPEQRVTFTIFKPEIK